MRQETCEVPFYNFVDIGTSVMIDDGPHAGGLDGGGRGGIYLIHTSTWLRPDDTPYTLSLIEQSNVVSVKGLRVIECITYLNLYLIY